jgi:hypothetical protein
MDTLRDVFTDQPAEQPTTLLAEQDRIRRERWTETQATPVVPPVDPAQVERDYERLTERRRAAQLAAVARQNAATARQVAQSFGEYGRAFRKVAATKGSPVDHAVCLFLAATCEEQADEYTRLQDESMKTADRQGSI